MTHLRRSFTVLTRVTAAPAAGWNVVVTVSRTERLRRAARAAALSRSGARTAPARRAVTRAVFNFGPATVRLPGPGT